MSTNKRVRLEANLISPPSEFDDAAKKILDLKAKQALRAARFNIPEKPLTSSAIAQVGSISKDAYLTLTRSAPEGTATISGIDVAGDDERARALKRAERFNITSFDYATERQREAGLSEEAIRLRAERRERAARFGRSDPLDLEIAKAAFLALGSARSSQTTGTIIEGIESIKEVKDEDENMKDDKVETIKEGDDTTTSSSSSSSSSTLVDVLTSTEMSLGASTSNVDIGIRRPNVLHIRSYKYLPASTADIEAFFSPLRPTLVEWLNGDSLNLIFQDEATAKRALELNSEPIPICPEVESVHPDWRICLKPLVKMKTDKYAPEGAETTVYLRFATSIDTKANAVKTRGARSQGTYSKEGLFSKKAIQKDVNAARRGQLASYDRAPLHVAAMVTESLTSAAAAVLQAQEININDGMVDDEVIEGKGEGKKDGGIDIEKMNNNDDVSGPTTLRIEVMKERVPAEKRFGGTVRRGGTRLHRVVVREKLGEGILMTGSQSVQEVTEEGVDGYDDSTRPNEDDTKDDRRVGEKRKERSEAEDEIDDVKREAEVEDAVDALGAEVKIEGEGGYNDSFDVDKALADAEAIEALM
jgi:hypothetical protein